MQTFNCTNGAWISAILFRLRRAIGLSLSLYFIGIILTSLSISFYLPVSAFAAVAKENRTFTEFTAATETGASTTSVVPARGLLFYQTMELVSATDPRSNQLVQVTVVKLKFAVDPERITGRMVNLMQFPAAGAQEANANPEVVATSAGGTVAVNAGDTFVLDQSVPFDWQPSFTLFLNNTSISAHDLGGGLTRVIVPYSVFEGGCSGEGFGSCTTPPGVRFLNGDSDPFDGVVHFAEVIVNRTTKTIESMRSRVNTAISGFVPPGASNGKYIAFFHSEFEQDDHCVNSGGSRTLGFSLACSGPPALNGHVQLGVDRNEDGFISEVLTLYDVDTNTGKFTKLKASVGLLLAPDGSSLGAVGHVDVENFQLSMGGDLLAFKSKDQPAFPAQECPPEMVGCVPFPGRVGIDFNNDNDFLDTFARYVSASGLFTDPSLTPTLGSIISNRGASTPEQVRPGDLLGTDGRYIFYYLSEEESPAPPSTTFPPTCLDLNADCDNMDFVLHSFDTQTLAITNAMAALRAFGGSLTQSGSGIVSFGTDERSEGPPFSFGTDFNSDTDFEDTQNRFFDANTQTLVTTNVTLTDADIVNNLTVGTRFGSLPNSDGEIIAYTAAILNGQPLGNDTPIDIRFIRVAAPPAPADTTSPVITISSPTQGANFILNSALTVLFSATDPEPSSGLSSVSATLNGALVTSGSMLVLSTPGINTLAVTATDNAGNSSTKTLTFTVTYQFSGFLPPVSGSVFKLGSTIPVKFQLTDANGGFVSTAVAHVTLQSSGAGPIDATPTGKSNSGNTFRYDSTSNQYIYNLSTKPLSVGTWQLIVTLDDGTVHVASIVLK